MKPVLVAVPQEWEELCQHVENAGFGVVRAYSYPAALEIIQSQNLGAAVLISDWAITQENGSAGLMKYLKGKIPTYSLITASTYKNHGDIWLFEVYERPRHEYQHATSGISVEFVLDFLSRYGSFE